MDETEVYRTFIEFYYPELKSLALTFISLVSSVLAFSVVFAEKIVVVSGGLTRRHIPIVSAWMCLVLSLIFCGFGLWRLFGAAQIARGWNLPSFQNYDRLASFNATYDSLYSALNYAGLLFVLGLLLITLSGVIRLRFSARPGPAASNSNTGGESDLRSEHERG
jgi:hypothetical protein